MKTCPFCAEEIKDAAIVCKHCGRDLTAAPPAQPVVSNAAPSAASTMESHLTCDKCRAGQMSATKVRRFSPGLVAIGFTLWIPALLVLLGVGACSILSTGAGGSASMKHLEQAKQDATKNLGAINGVTPEMIAAFTKDGAIAETTLATLPPDARTRVDAVTSAYYARVGGAAFGTAIATGVGGCAVVTVYVVCLPVFIVGLILTLKKKVWRCASCGYIFDRA